VSGGFTSDKAYVYIYDYLGNETWNLTTNLTVAISRDVQHMFVGDADNDGVDELVLAVGKFGVGELYVYEYEDGNYTRTTIDADRTKFNRDIYVGDATNNGLNELVFGEGESNNVYFGYVVEPPLFSQILLNISNINASDAPGVTVAVQDSDALSSVTLYWSDNGVIWNSTPMSVAYNYTYEAQISEYAATTSVSYYVKAVDDTGDTNQTVIFNYTVLSDPNVPIWSTAFNFSPITFNTSAQLHFNLSWSDFDDNGSGMSIGVSIEINRSGNSTLSLSASPTNIC